MGRKLQIKRGLQADIPILSEGEFGLTTDQKKLYIGAPGGNVRLATEADISAVNVSLSGVIEKQNILNDFLGYNSADIYGIEVDIQNNTTTRLSASVGKNAGADFNSVPMYKRRRCILADDGTLLAYKGDIGYTETGKLSVTITKNGTVYAVDTQVQVMVEQPQFYYRRVPLVFENNIDGIGLKLRKWRDYITHKPTPDFKLHPNFLIDGQELDYVYYPAYEGSVYDVSANKYLAADEQVTDFAISTGDKLSSIANAQPASGRTQSLNLINSRIIAQNRGNGWQLLDAIACSAEQMLMSIEYCGFDLQTYIGFGVVNKPWIEDAVNYSINTGATSNLGDTSGMASGTNGLTSVTYRGRENPWGNIWKWLDGFNLDCTKKVAKPYLSNRNHQSDITTTPYIQCGFTLPRTDGFISAIGYSQTCDYTYFAAETSGASNRPINDCYWQNGTYAGMMATLVGAGWANGVYAGAWAVNSSIAAGDCYRNIGAALLYRPIK